MKKSTKLILMRHGQSVWNEKNLFTGWVDVPLSQKGVNEALEGGKKLQNIPIDIVFTSTLIRAQMTLFLALLNHKEERIPVFVPQTKKEEKDAKIFDPQTLKKTIPVIASWHLNERKYGKLQGLNKDATRKKYGEEQVKIWRRSFEIAPPGGESLKMTSKRTLPYFQKKIVPFLKKGKNVFISAHGNSLRSIVMELDQLSKEEVLELEIPTGKPIFYEYKNGKFIKDGN